MGAQAGLAVSTSANGRWVAFTSTLALSSIDTNHNYDAYVLDRLTGEYELASVDAAGQVGPEASFAQQISDDGRLVLMTSDNQLSPRDIGTARDVYMRHRNAGFTDLVSETNPPRDGMGTLYDVRMSGDGRFAVWLAMHGRENVQPDGNGMLEDILVRDGRQSGIFRANVNSQGAQGTGVSTDFAISRDGRFVVFSDRSTNLVSEQRPGEHVYIHELSTGTTERVDTATAGVASEGGSGGLSVSNNGDYVAFLGAVPTIGLPVSVQIIIKNRRSGAFTIASRDAFGEVRRGWYFADPELSPDGKYILFREPSGQWAGDLGPNVGTPSFYIRRISDDAIVRIGYSDRPSDQPRGYIASSPKAHWSAGGEFISFASPQVLVLEAMGRGSSGYVYSWCGGR